MTHAAVGEYAASRGSSGRERVAMSGTVLVGEACCLAAALCWAVAVQLFRRPITEYGANAVNLAKCVIAAALLVASTLVMGQLPALLSASSRALVLVAISGLIGMTLGDTALFASVDRLGVHRALLMQCLAPLFTAAIAVGLYHERLGPFQLLGGVVILGGVLLVILGRPADEAGSSPERLDAAGLVYGVVAAFGQGTGVVLAKAGMEEIPFLAASALRLTTAAMGLLVVMPAVGRGAAIGRVLGSGRALKRLLGPTVLGTYVAILLMMAGVAYAPASIAAVLLAMPPVFSLFIESRVIGRRITARGLLGTMLAVAGVALLATLG